MARLKDGFAAQQYTMLRQTQVNLSSVRDSFKVAKLIASCGKLFSEVEFVKKCLKTSVSRQERCSERGESVRIYSNPAN